MFERLFGWLSGESLPLAIRTRWQLSRGASISPRDRRRMGGGTEIVVAYPICVPPKGRIMNALRPYGVKVLDYNDEIIGIDGEVTNDVYGRGAFFKAYVRVRNTQAEWAEYLILRKGGFRLMSPPINPKNARWAARHNGMPVPWDSSTGRLRRWKQRACDGSCAIGDAQDTGSSKPGGETGRKRKERRPRRRPRTRTRRRNK